MTTLTLQQAAAYARGAGFTGDDLVDIVAVATPESSLSTTVVNSIGCVGVWQINQPVHVHDHPNWTVAYLQDPANNAAAAKTIFDQQGMRAWQAWTDGSAAAYLPSARAAVASVGGGSAAGTATLPIASVTQADKTNGYGCDTVECCKKKYADSWWFDDSLRRDSCIYQVNQANGVPQNDQGAPDILGGAVNGLGSIAHLTIAAAAWMSDPNNWSRLLLVVLGGGLVLIGLEIVGAPVLSPLANALPQGRALSAVKTLKTAVH